MSLKVDWAFTCFKLAGHIRGQSVFLDIIVPLSE